MRRLGAPRTRLRFPVGSAVLVAAVAAMLPALVAAVPAAAVPAARAATAASTAAAEPAARLVFAAEEGSWPVHGAGDWAAPDAEVRAWEYENVVKIDGETDGGRNYVRVEFNAPDNAVVQAGPYPGTRHLGAPEVPGILVVSNGFGCLDDYADVEVKRIERDAERGLTLLDLTLEHHCGAPDAPVLRVQVHFAA
jgi:hypothetical protein